MFLWNLLRDMQNTGISQSVLQTMVEKKYLHLKSLSLVQVVLVALSRVSAAHLLPLCDALEIYGWGGTVRKLHLRLYWQWWWGCKMERAEGCCSAVHEAQLWHWLAKVQTFCLGLHVKGELWLSAQLESSFCLVMSEAMITLMSLSTLRQAVWRAAFKVTPEKRRFKGKCGSVAEA